MQGHGINPQHRQHTNHQEPIIISVIIETWSSQPCVKPWNSNVWDNQIYFHLILVVLHFVHCNPKQCGGTFILYSEYIWNFPKYCLVNPSRHAFISGSIICQSFHTLLQESTLRATLAHNTWCDVNADILCSSMSWGWIWHCLVTWAWLVYDSFIFWAKRLNWQLEILLLLLPFS